MKKQHLVIIGLAFITILISLFFGVSIQNAQDNFLIEHLNVEDGINYFSKDEVPKLSFTAAFVTAIFVPVMLGLELYVIIKTPYKLVKKMALACSLLLLVIISFIVMTLINPHYFNFKEFGMVWVLLSMSIIFINIISVFTKK